MANTYKDITNDKEKFSILIHSIEKDLYNIAKLKVTDVNDIDDILQETIIQIYTNLPNLNNKNSFKNWAITILLNECNKFYRNKNKQLSIFNKIINKLNCNLFDNSMENLENQLSFKQILSNFSEIDQNILLLYYECKYSIKEIATVLNMNENTVKSKLNRSKAKIKKMYFKEGDESDEEKECIGEKRTI